MFNTGYNRDNNLQSEMTALHCSDESLAIQSSEEESNINTIVRRFGLTGELPNDVNMPMSGDFTSIPDFHTAMNMVRSAQEEFLRVPADIRARFSNDPQEFMNFFENPDNIEEARKLGFMNPIVPVPEPLNVRVVPEPPQN